MPSSAGSDPSDLPPNRLGGEIVVTRTFEAPADLVFEAWTEAEHLRRWFCPDGFAVSFCTCEFREGGRFDVCMRSPDGQDFWWKSRYREIVRPERIVFATAVSISDGPTLFEALATVTFSAQRDATLVRVHQAFTLHDPTAAGLVELAEPGWTHALGQLAALLMRPKPGG